MENDNIRSTKTTTEQEREVKDYYYERDGVPLLSLALCRRRRRKGLGPGTLHDKGGKAWYCTRWWCRLDLSQRCGEARGSLGGEREASQMDLSTYRAALRAYKKEEPLGGRGQAPSSPGQVPGRCQGPWRAKEICASHHTGSEMGGCKASRRAALPLPPGHPIAAAAEPKNPGPRRRRRASQEP